MSVISKILQTKIEMSEKLNKILLSNSPVCGKKKSMFIKNKEPHNFNTISID